MIDLLNMQLVMKLITLLTYSFFSFIKLGVTIARLIIYPHTIACRPQLVVYNYIYTSLDPHFPIMNYTRYENRS